MMLSRIFWVGLAGIALVTGMILQDGDRMFAWTDGYDMSARTERAIEAGVERAIEGSVDGMEITGSDGRQIDVRPEAKRALAAAVGRLVEAEADLAVVKIRDGSNQERQAAETRRDQARTEVETLKGEIERQEQLAQTDSNVVREQVRQEIRADIRQTVRDTVRN